MRTVGQILKEEREKKFYTLDEIEKITKIRKELLQALEEGHYSKLPPATFVQGFIKNYGKFLGLNTEKLLAVFRREFSEGKNPPRVLESLKNPIEDKKLKVTPRRVLVGMVFTLVLIFFIYLWFQYRSLVGSPMLDLSSPVDQLTTSAQEVEIKGKTDPEAKVTINDQEITTDQSGSFFQKIELSENVNNIVIIATSKSGKQTKLQRTIFLKR
jgi:cytoskeletal protein RodZ